eukprot:CCRYP_016556-RA/>CCRYP_016556-RA protein AED:0.18 eAED:0.18 QI:131/-1/0/1/-1/1/1/0/291
MDLGLGHQREATFKDGCLSVRQVVIEKLSAGISPGPIYNPNLSASSTCRVKSRDITFGSGPARFGDVPNIHRRAGAPMTVQQPGPHTYCPDAIKKAIFLQSNHKNPPSIKFGTGKRDCNKGMSFSKITPSPAEYDPESIRRGINFSKKGSPNIKFGTAKPIEEHLCTKPGPQTYCPDAIRKGINATKRGMPRVKFGSPPKKPLSTEGKSRNDQPGPQHYDTDSLRKALFALSTKKRPAGVKFTTGPRTYNDAEGRERASKLGPCTYSSASSLGSQVNSKYKSQPSISFGAR